MLIVKSGKRSHSLINSKGKYHVSLKKLA